MSTPETQLPLSSLRRVEGVGPFSLGLPHWAMPPRGGVCVAAEGEGPAPAAAGPSAAWAAPPAPVFVYKPGSARQRNTAPLPGAAAAASPAEGRGCRAPGTRGGPRPDEARRARGTGPARRPAPCSTPAFTPAHQPRPELQSAWLSSSAAPSGTRTRVTTVSVLLGHVKD